MADRYVDGRPGMVSAPYADIFRAPDGARERQWVRGTRVTIFEDLDGWSFVQSAEDAYIGYVRSDLLGQIGAVTHWVAVPAGHAYSKADIKSAEVAVLYFGARLEVVSHQPKFFELADGSFVPKPFLRPIDRRFSDPVTVAQMFFGAPYLWGGNTVAGIDCSGLVQLGFSACGQTCPADSDMQEAEVGHRVDDVASVQRGDLLFWRGHVALAVDTETLIHANAHHMAVAYEPIERAIVRIEAQGDGPITAIKRLVAA